jgi:fructuronate reductase
VTAGVNAAAPLLTRAGAGRPAAPVRIVHLGAGAFHRSHQAWFTSRSSDAAQWGIASFTGRSTSVADRLAPQGGLFTLIERGAERDRFDLVDSISEVHPASDITRLMRLVAAPRTAIVTLTITEAGYHLGADGTLDLEDDAVAADVTALRSGRVADTRTPLGRLLAGLAGRRRAGAGPISVVPCDNLPGNGALVGSALRLLASVAGLRDALEEVSFVTTSVDRITPRTTAADARAVAAVTGWRDAGCVVAEPFADWTLSGTFPAGRPDWPSAGVRLVDEIAPFEQRKLLLLNGGHLVLAFTGLTRGLSSVAEAHSDAVCRARLEEFWSEASRSLDARADATAYRRSLHERFANTRIEHRLDQIATDTATKLRLRVLPVIAAERAAGREPSGALHVLAAWRTLLEAGRLDAPPAVVRDVLAAAEAPQPSAP